MNMNILAKVVNAPGYEDFEGVLLWQEPDWPMSVVGTEWDSIRADIHVVPSACVRVV